MNRRALFPAAIGTLAALIATPVLAAERHRPHRDPDDLPIRRDDHDDGHLRHSPARIIDRDDRRNPNHIPCPDLSLPTPVNYIIHTSGRTYVQGEPLFECDRAYCGTFGDALFIAQSYQARADIVDVSIRSVYCGVANVTWTNDQIAHFAPVLRG